MVLLFGSYYFLFLKPRFALPKALKETSTLIVNYHAVLLENRLPISELSKLDPLSGQFNFERATLIKELNESNLQATNLFNDSAELPSVVGLPVSEIGFYQELKSTVSQLNNQSMNMLSDQKKIIDQLILLDNALNNLFLYDPVQDLAKLDMRKDTKKIIKRATDAQTGLNKIKERLVDMEPDSYGELTSQINSQQKLLATLAEELNNNQFDKAQKTKSDFITSYLEFKKKAWSVEEALVKSPEMIDLLTKQTNLILKYDYWLKRIEAVVE